MALQIAPAVIETSRLEVEKVAMALQIAPAVIETSRLEVEV